MIFSVMKLIGINFVIVLIFYSFNDVFVSSWAYKMFMGIDWLLSNYHNIITIVVNAPSQEACSAPS